jgi:protein-S-isoprenylcysteine O-methyltransferase Ste14
MFGASRFGRVQRWQRAAKRGTLPIRLTIAMSTSAGQSLLTRLVRRTVASQLMMTALLFLPAGSLKYWPGWGYLAANLVSGLWVYIYFYRRDPQLLERRLLKREKFSEQKLIQILWRALSIVFLVLAGADYRFGWSRGLFGPVPWWLIVPALLIVLVGYHLIFRVFKANSFAASVVQVEAGQAVIDTGPYRFVRHPLYTGSFIIWISSPLALGSFVLTPVFLLLLPILAFRLSNEEKVLRRDLPGYVAYCQRTRYRLIPFMW